MLMIEPIQCEPTSAAKRREDAVELIFPGGIFGFESSKRFRLATPEDTHPFVWLEGQDGDRHSFLAIPAQEVLKNYTIELSDEDVAAIGLTSPEEAAILNLAIYHPEGFVTANLKGPLIYNRDTLIARQVVPKNAADLPVAARLSP
jgi:flagellar assembly factor FliW